MGSVPPAAPAARAAAHCFTNTRCFINAPTRSLILAEGCSIVAGESGAMQALRGPAEPSAAQAASLHAAAAEPQSGVWELQGLQHCVLSTPPAGCADPELHRALPQQQLCPSNPVLGTARLPCSNSQHPWPQTHPQDSRAVGQTHHSLPAASHAEGTLHFPHGAALLAHRDGAAGEAVRPMQLCKARGDGATPHSYCRPCSAAKHPNCFVPCSIRAAHPAGEVGPSLNQVFILHWGKNNRTEQSQTFPLLPL